MLVLLPPSEAKTIPTHGAALDLNALSLPALTPARSRAVAALTKLCNGPVRKTRTVLGLSDRQDDLVELNANLTTTPTAAAIDVYSGVLYDALNYRALPIAARRRLDSWLLISSALWGVIGSTDHIPPYRLSGDASLPRLGTLATFWKRPLAEALDGVDADVVFDLRSGTYAAMWRPPAHLAARTVQARVMHRRPDGSVKVVSHFNKATKGRVVAALAQKAAPRSLDALAQGVAGTGAAVELLMPQGGRSGRLDIVVNDL